MRLPVLALLIIATASSLPAQAGGFVVTLGTDTVQVERFLKQGIRLEGTVVQRTPSLRIITYSLTFSSDGRPQRYEATARTAEGSPAPGSGSLTWIADSVVRETVQNGQPVTHRIAAPNGVIPAPGIPYLGVSFLMYETGLTLARRLASTAADPAWSTLTMIPVQVQPGRIRVWLIGADSAEADYFGQARSGYRFDQDGRLLRIDWTGTTYRYRGVRVPAFDVDTIARAWAADEQRGVRFGALSPRDSLRSSVGAAAIGVDYSRPSKRGRRVWGELVPWNQVWRLGADMATHFTTSADITVGTTKVPAGQYTLWMLPSESGPSMLIINSRIRIFGTMYNPATDFARITMERSTLREPVERLTIVIDQGRLSVRWGDAEWSVLIAQ